MVRTSAKALLVVGVAAIVAGGASDAGADGAVATGAVTGSVSIEKDGAAKADRSGVAVYLENAPAPKAAPERRTIHQKDLMFSPRLLVIPTGTTVDFPNDDKVFHNVFSLSKGAKFDLGLYKSGTSKSVTFTEPAVIDVYCNIHPDMAAKIKVIDSSYYAVTGADGSFTIKNVPAGTYPIVGWQRYGKEFRGEVTVTKGGKAAVQIALVEAEGPQRHLRKDGTPYGRYK